MTHEERLTRIEEGWLELQQGQRELQQAIASLTGTIDKFITGSDERLKRIETNLDILIRAITTEHTNGKGKV